MDFPISSSVILAIAVAFWLVGLTSVFSRRARQKVLATVMVEDVPSVMAPQGKSLESHVPASTTTGPEAPMMEQNSTAGPTTAPVKIRIRRGRAALALTGLVSLVVLLVGSVLAMAGVVASGLPFVAFLVFAASFVSLRQLAKGDSRRRVQRAFTDAMSTTPEPAAAPAAPLNVATVPFDAAAHEPAPEPKVTAAELREAALAVAREAGDQTWEPVEVPRPLYIDAPVVPRAAPAPLNLPEAPKAEGKTRIKDDQRVKTAVPDIAPAAEGVAAAKKDEPALRNLDAVLQRRRA